MQGGTEATAPEFAPLGRYHAYLGGETAIYLRLPNNQGEYVDWLHWGYSGEESPGEGWVKSEPLAAYEVPPDATAVRLHIKAKAKVVTWGTGSISAGLRVKVRPSGETGDRNEVIHAFTEKVEGEPGYGSGRLTTEDLNHAVVDVRIGPDRRIDIWRDAVITGTYADVELVVYLAGYWMP